MPPPPTTTTQVQGIAFQLRKLPDARAAAAALTVERRTTIEAAFRAIDADGSGDIDSDELHGAVRVLELNLRPEEVSDLIQAVDRDGSGSIDLGEVAPTLLTQAGADRKWRLAMPVPGRREARRWSQWSVWQPYRASRPCTDQICSWPIWRWAGYEDHLASSLRLEMCPWTRLGAMTLCNIPLYAGCCVTLSRNDWDFGVA